MFEKNKIRFSNGKMNMDIRSNGITLERLSNLKRLEAEGIHIIREVASEFSNPVMLYSIGKDSGVMLHLAMKAFYPSNTNGQRM